MQQPPEKRYLPGPSGDIAVYVHGDPLAPAVLMTHSILSSSMMWAAQAELLTDAGLQVIRADTRGHGESHASAAPYAMDDLVADSIAVLDALKIERAHYVGLSLGGMSGFGLGIQHPDRLLSLCLCDARADMTSAFAAPWDERIAQARAQGCGVLAKATAERWFGPAFMQANPAIASAFLDAISRTSVEGFAGCAYALQQLDYLPKVGSISSPTTLIVGANDGPLPQLMLALQALIPGAVLEVIANAGHLPNIDQPIAFNTALMRHFSNNPSRS